MAAWAEVILFRNKMSETAVYGHYQQVMKNNPFIWRNMKDIIVYFSIAEMKVVFKVNIEQLSCIYRITQ